MMHKVLTIAAVLLAQQTIRAQEALMFVGTYTNGKSEGIYSYRFDPLQAEARQVSVTTGIRNPSFLAVSPGGRFLYAVSELNGGGDAGRVVAYRVDGTNGTLQRINEQSSGGDDPCYVTVDKTGRWVIVGNYSSGSLSVLPINGDGSLGPAVSRQVHEGSGPDASRQEKPHVHATVLSPDNRYVYVPDLGADKIFIYRFDSETGKLLPGEMPYRAAHPGSGPRHFVFHPEKNYAYLVEELTGSVSVYHQTPKNGTLAWVQRLSTLPAGFQGSAGSADIHITPDGRFLYATNRGDANNIAIFRIDRKNGKLSPIGHQSAAGIHPRNFSISPDGRWLLCANRDSDAIVVFQRDRKSGKLTETGKYITVPTPVCIGWAR
jgi:6-phosphogluconolactonase